MRHSLETLSAEDLTQQVKANSGFRGQMPQNMADVKTKGLASSPLMHLFGKSGRVFISISENPNLNMKCSCKAAAGLLGADLSRVIILLHLVVHRLQGKSLPSSVLGFLGELYSAKIN